MTKHHAYAIRAAFEEGFALAKYDGPIEKAWELSDARQVAGIYESRRPDGDGQLAGGSRAEGRADQTESRSLAGSEPADSPHD